MQKVNVNYDERMKSQTVENYDASLRGHKKKPIQSSDFFPSLSGSGKRTRSQLQKVTFFPNLKQKFPK